MRGAATSSGLKRWNTSIFSSLSPSPCRWFCFPLIVFYRVFWVCRNSAESLFYYYGFNRNPLNSNENQVFRLCECLWEWCAQSEIQINPLIACTRCALARFFSLCFAIYLFVLLLLLHAFIWSDPHLRRACNEPISYRRSHCAPSIIKRVAFYF